MKKALIISAAILTAVILGFSLYKFILSPSQPIPESEESMTAMQESTEDDSATPIDTTNPRYVEYSKAAFDSTSDNRRILFFYASWCPTCRPADAIFSRSTDKIPSDVTLIRVNYNDPDTDQEEKDLANKYGVTYQHTFVQIDNAGNEITKWNGGQITELLTNVK